MLLATGVRDELPTIAGLVERWGRSVFQCPYCHGYELDMGRIDLIALADLTRAPGHAERRAASDMIPRPAPGSARRLTLSADKGYDAAEFVADLRQDCVTPHMA